MSTSELVTLVACPVRHQCLKTEEITQLVSVGKLQCLPLAMYSRLEGSSPSHSCTSEPACDVCRESGAELLHAVVELCFTSSVRFLQPGLLLKVRRVQL